MDINGHGIRSAGSCCRLTGPTVLLGAVLLRRVRALAATGIAFLVMSLFTSTVQATCTFTSFWSGGCDKEIKEGITVAAQVSGTGRLVGMKPAGLNCGAENQAPCNVLQWIPSCDPNLKEDFDANRCVALAPGEWSSFFAGLKSASKKAGSDLSTAGSAARRVCMDTAADFIQKNGASLYAPRAVLPAAMTGISPTLEAYVAVGFVCSTPSLLNTIGAIANEVSKLGGTGESMEKQLSGEYQKYYDSPICQSSKDAAGRVACAVAGMVGGEASDGVMCVIGGVQAGAFNGFATGGVASERALGLAIGQVLFILGQTYMTLEATKAMSKPMRDAVWRASKQAVVAAWEAGAISFNAAADTIETLGNVGSIISTISTVVGGVRAAEGTIGKLGNVRPCNLPVSSEGKPYQSIVTDWGYVYGVQANGDLWYWRVDAGGAVGAAGQIGTGWNMRFVTSGDYGEIFVVDQSGDLRFYQHDASLRWLPHSGIRIGTGWVGMKAVFAGGNVVSGGRMMHQLYAIDSSGSLLLYRFASSGGEPLVSQGSQVIGWGWNFPKVFAARDGRVYVIDSAGQLLRYGFDMSNPTGTTPVPKVMGSGWSGMKHVFAGPGGAIYAVSGDGKLYYYRDRGDAVLGPEYLGFGFAQKELTGMLKW